MRLDSDRLSLLAHISFGACGFTSGWPVDRHDRFLALRLADRRQPLSRVIAHMLHIAVATALRLHLVTARGRQRRGFRVRDYPPLIPGAENIDRLSRPFHHGGRCKVELSHHPSLIHCLGRNACQALKAGRFRLHAPSKLSLETTEVSWWYRSCERPPSVRTVGPESGLRSTPITDSTSSCPGQGLP
jgi:hypothetical protein